MASTYTPIATTTLGTDTTSVTFNSFSGYSDLILVINGKLDTAAENFYVTINSDTGSNYSITALKGNGTAASSARLSSQSIGYLDYQGAGATTDDNIYIVQFLNYSNSNTYKTYLCRHNRPNGWVEALVGLWRSTSAITSLLIAGSTSSKIKSGSTLTLYGIKAA